MNTVYWSGRVRPYEQWYLLVNNTPVLSLTRCEGYYEVKLFFDNTVHVSIDDEGDLQRVKKKAICIYKTMLVGHIDNIWKRLDSYENILSCL